MTKYIDAFKAQVHLEGCLRTALSVPDERNPNLAEGYRLALNIIMGAPAADTERHAYWVSGNRGPCCIACGLENYKESKYCPNCGAKMDGDIK